VMKAGSALIKLSNLSAEPSNATGMRIGSMRKV
jgi:hypothetical protein